MAAALSGRYEIQRELGQGGMATVFLARDVKHDRLVAIKVLRPELAASLGPDRFLREIRLAAQLQHPHIVGLLDSGEANDESGRLLYYVMPYVEGESLRERLAREGALPIEDAVRLAREVADALAYAHARGIVHRDIKPENIMLSGRHALVTDFGVARAVSQATGTQNLTTVGVALGTPAYMAPEQVAADPATDHRADIYALGLVTFEMVTGRGPFGDLSPQQLLAAHVTQPIPDLRTIRADTPAPFAGLVARCLAKPPAERPATADEIVKALESIATPAAGTVPVPARIYPPRLRWWIAGICGVAAVAFVVIVLFNRGPAEPGNLSVAVMPFGVEGGDTAQVYLAEGITDAVQTILQKVPNLRVTGPASSAIVAGSGATPQQVGQRLGVTRLLRASVRRRGDSVRVSADFVDASDGHSIWKERFDRPFSDAFGLEDEIAGRIVDELKLVLTGAPRTSAQAGRTANSRAYDQYLLGRHALAQFTEPFLRKALAHFDSALAIDPNFALAWTGIGEVWTWLADEYESPQVAYPKVAEAARRALAIDSAVSNAHAMRAMGMEIIDHDFPGADREYQRAMQLDPNNVTALEFYSNFLVIARRGEDCLPAADRAEALDPQFAFASWIRGSCLYTLRRYRDAINEMKRMGELDPNFVYFDIIDGAALRELGDYNASVAAYRRMQPHTDKPLYGLGVTYARMGLRDSALRVAHDLEALSQTRYITPPMIGAIYANLGTPADIDKAFTFLEDPKAQAAVGIFMLNFGPEFDRIRDDPRAQTLLRNAKLRL